MFVYTIQPDVKPVWQPVVSCIQTFNRLLNRVVQPVWQPAVSCIAGCQTGCTTRFDNRLNESPVYTIQPVVNMVVKLDWQPVKCLYTRHNRLSNRFDNRLYSVYSRLSNRLYNTVWQPVERTVERAVAVRSTRFSNRLPVWQPSVSCKQTSNRLSYRWFI